MPIIEFEIDLLSGKTTITGHQFKGVECINNIKPYLEKIGRATETRAKPEQALINTKQTVKQNM